MNAEDIRNVTFDKVMRGYRPEEVDAYLDRGGGTGTPADGKSGCGEKNVHPCGKGGPVPQ